MDAISRRQFFAVGGGAAIGVGFGLGFTSLHRTANAQLLLRPPGALDEQDFLAACIRCGQCVEACPTDVLRLTDLEAGRAAATPYFVAAENPCNLCQGHDSMLCIDACPTAALTQLAFEDVDIGRAHLCKGKCLAYNGTVCRACWQACPYPDDAIQFDERLRPQVRTSHCVGCGLCEYACPTDPKAITITSRDYLQRTGSMLHQGEGDHEGTGQGAGRGQGAGLGQGRGQGQQHPESGGEP